MKFSYRWLCEYFAEPPSLATVCDLLTRGGIEVEGVSDLGAGSGQIVVGEVRSVAPHPNADKLRLVTVAVGDGDAAPTHEVVCGAPNVAVGGRYPLALEGATLPDGTVLKKSKIRGVESRGMLCSGRELGLTEDHDGILELGPVGYRVGEPFDAIIETKVTPDRPDCLSLQGLARDLAALGGLAVRFPTVRLAECDPPAAARCGVEVRDAVGCPRYLARVVEGVTIGPSPLWMRRRLESSGLRAINNIVDVTNYVLLETGHPLHGFDLDRLAGRRIVVRRAFEGEHLRLLDDTELKLAEADLVIADEERAQVLAGVMGGEESEVHDATRHVLIECACFHPASIRRSSRRHGKASESSYRFERGVNYHDMEAAIDRAAQLMAELGGGRVARGVVDVAAGAPPTPRIEVGVARCNRLLGTALDAATIRHALERLEFTIFAADGDHLVVAPPAHRLDVHLDADVFEEVARVVGYDAIPTSLPRLEMGEVEEAPDALLARELREVMVGAGYAETLTYSFTHPRLLAPFVAEADRDALVLANPISPETSTMRGSLVASLLQVASLNQRRGEGSLALFEVGATFHPRRDAEAAAAERRRAVAAAPEGRLEATELVREEQRLAVVAGGVVGADWRTSGKGRVADFHDMKGVAELLLGHLGIADATCERAADVAWLHPGRSARWRRGDAALVVAGQVHPDLAPLFDLRDERVLVLEADLGALLAARGAGRRHRALPRHPAVGRALAFVVAEEVAAGALEAVIREAGGALLEAVRPIDVYRGEHVAAGTKSIAFDLVFRAADRSLADDEVNERVAKIVRKAEAAHGATLRA